MESPDRLDQIGLILRQTAQRGQMFGDELRAILENAPRLALLICQGIPSIHGEGGRSRALQLGELRRMADEGKLTADLIFRAL